MATSLWDLGLQGANAYNIYENLGDVRSDIKTGVDQASTAINTAYQPYTDYGKQSLADIQGREDFSYTGQDMYSDPSYQWRFNQGLQAIDRSAASKHMLNSGATLASLTNYGQQAASQEYQNAFNRAKTTYDTNMAKDQFGVTTGATAAGKQGENLADIAIGQAGALANVHGAEMNAWNKQLSALGDLGQVGGIPGTILDEAGNIIDGAGNIISNLWSGGGLDGNGDWGLLGDLGGLVTGNYGDNYTGDFTSAEISGMFPGLFDANGNPYYDPGQDFNAGTNWWDDLSSSITQGWEDLTSWATDFFQ